MIPIKVFGNHSTKNLEGFSIIGFIPNPIDEGDYLLIKPEKYFHGYRITHCGKFYSKKGNLLSLEKRPRKNSKNFDWTVKLNINGKQKKFTCSRLILECFHGPGHGLEALHINDDPSNIHCSNLRWGTRSVNMVDMWKSKNDKILFEYLNEYAEKLEKEDEGFKTVLIAEDVETGCFKVENFYDKNYDFDEPINMEVAD